MLQKVSNTLSHHPLFDIYFYIILKFKLYFLAWRNEYTSMFQESLFLCLLSLFSISSCLKQWIHIYVSRKFWSPFIAFFYLLLFFNLNLNKSWFDYKLVHSTLNLTSAVNPALWRGETVYKSPQNKGFYFCPKARGYWSSVGKREDSQRAIHV